jgi:hypothetical protein
MAENKSLKVVNQAMVLKIEALETAVAKLVAKLDKNAEDFELLGTTVAKLVKKAEDTEFRIYIVDAFRYIRDGIVAKGTSATFPKGSDCMSLMYSSQDLEFPDPDDYEESEVDEWNAVIAEVTKKNADYLIASTFLSGLGLDASSVRDLRVFTGARSNTYNEDCELTTKLKVTNRKNQAALKELLRNLQRLDEGHAAFPLKARLTSWCDSVIVK